MSGMNLAAGYGAGGAADALKELLATRFAQQVQMQQEADRQKAAAEQVRQFDTQEGRLASGQQFTQGLQASNAATELAPLTDTPMTAGGFGNIPKINLRGMTETQKAAAAAADLASQRKQAEWKATEGSKPVTVGSDTSLIDPTTGAVKFQGKPKPPTAEEDATRYVKIAQSTKMGTPVSPEDAAWAKAYEQLKTIGPEAAAATSADRQTAAFAHMAATQADQQKSASRRAFVADVKPIESNYLDAMEKSSTMKNVVDAAMNGNVVAGNLQPLLGALMTVTTEGVKRINVPEINTIAGAGSIQDRINGWIGKAADGQPLPPNVQKDLKALADILATNARHRYEQGFSRAQDLHGVTDVPMIADPATASSSSKTTKPQSALDWLKTHGGGG